MEKSELMGNMDGLREAFLSIAKEAGWSEPECARQARRLFDGITEGLGDDKRVTLKAENAVIELIDKGSGQLVRRYLELQYEETSNGIRITGESMAGQEVQIVFLSESAIGKISELQGRGQDSPACDDHD